MSRTQQAQLVADVAAAVKRQVEKNIRSKKAEEESESRKNGEKQALIIQSIKVFEEFVEEESFSRVMDYPCMDDGNFITHIWLPSATLQLQFPVKALQKYPVEVSLWIPAVFAFRPFKTLDEAIWYSETNPDIKSMTELEVKKFYNPLGV